MWRRLEFDVRLRDDRVSTDCCLVVLPVGREQHVRRHRLDRAENGRHGSRRRRSPGRTRRRHHRDTLHIGLQSGTSVRNATLEADVTVPALSRIEVSGASQVHLADEFAATLSSCRLRSKRSRRRCRDLRGPGRSVRRVAGEPRWSRSPRSLCRRREQLQRCRVDRAIPDGEAVGRVEWELTVTDSLSAEVSGASALRYKGSPQITRQEVSGLSSITQI